MDLLSTIIERLEPRGRIFCRSEFTAPWGLAIPSSDFAHFHYVEQGEAWLRAERFAQRLHRGDLAFVTRGCAHLLLDDPRSAPLPLDRALALAHDGPGCRRLSLGGGGAAAATVCGSVRFASDDAASVLAVMPDLIVVPGEVSNPVDGGLSPLGRALRQMQDELQAARPGHAVAVARLIDLLFVHVLRDWLERDERPLSGWAAALRDPDLSASLAQLHAAPAQAWSVERLARDAAMSRSAFAERFTRVVGEPPLAYVTRVRMDAAARILRRERATVGDVAARVGYGSEAAFSRAFKRHHGRPPRDFRGNTMERDSPA